MPTMGCLLLPETWILFPLSFTSPYATHPHFLFFRLLASLLFLVSFLLWPLFSFCLFICFLSSVGSWPQPFPSLILSSLAFLFPDPYNLKHGVYRKDNLHEGFPLLMLKNLNLGWQLNGSLEVTWPSALFSAVHLGKHSCYLMLYHFVIY